MTPAADTREKMAVLMGHSFGGFGSSLFSAYVAEDLKNPDAYAVYLSHDGQGLLTVGLLGHRATSRGSGVRVAARSATASA